ncbi:cysteine desulfurase [Hypnocyclicus thermotrophus]|uniref:cysteine desulfurase n=1 Tax=Hypnocyclicus thermotrophus TaxID=1627895 RepID=A0AA46I6H4_9FUSO|nr:cysteine desulfurase family protein [Hypnocyclicus thermotrophus]TDT72342.1 cysteine desulfurase [Hypnocyclicus thermotrophus]
MRRVYLDNAATTKVDDIIKEKLFNEFDNFFGNPSSVHSEGQKSKMILEKSREKIADLLGVKSREIIFLSSGTEANNSAIKGIVYKNPDKHFMTTKIEHSSVLKTFEYLEKKDYKIDYISADNKGVVNIEELKSKITKKTKLISVMFANNEVGTIQPIKEIGEICKKNNIVFHVDAVQGIGKELINPKNLNIDIMSFSSHKFYGPRGAAGLYINTGIELEKLLHGGSQERKKRAGTENIFSIYGMAEALELSYSNIYKEKEKIKELRDYFENKILNEIKDIKINCKDSKRVVNISNITIKNIEAQSILFNLDLNGIAVSAGSACASSALTPSHVLEAIGLNKVDAKSSIRVSLGRYNTKEEIDYFIDKLSLAVEQERNLNF